MLIVFARWWLFPPVIDHCWWLACYDIIGDAQRCHLKHKGSTCDQDHMLWLETHKRDWSHAYATRDTLMRLQLHIGDVTCDWSHKYVTEDAICAQRCNRATALAASSLRDMLVRTAYIADDLGLIPLSPTMYYFTFMQATLIHLHNKTRSALVSHHYYCLGTSSNEPWWI
jgi:hypothetical protein